MEIKIFFIRNARMIFTVELKNCVIGASILGIIISKFCHKKNLCLIILFKVHKSLEVGFYYTILPLNFAVYLLIKGSEEFLLRNNIAITRNLRWIAIFGWWQLSLRDRDDLLLYWWWLLLSFKHQWWPWLVYNKQSW